MLTQRGSSAAPGTDSWLGMKLTLSHILQLLLWAAAIATLVWGFSDPRFRDAEGFLDSSVGVFVATGVALLVMGWAVAGRLRTFAFWFALALIGQAVTLQLIEAGPALRYQHYKPLDHLFTETQPLLLN